MNPASTSTPSGAGEAGLPRGTPSFHWQRVAAPGQRGLETAGMNPAYSSTSSSRGGGGPPPRDPLLPLATCGGAWSARSGDGRNESGLHLHSVWAGGGGPPPRDPLLPLATCGGAWSARSGDGRNESGLQLHFV